MPLRPSFFDDPLLRLTPPSALNDPFDSKPTNIGVEKKLEFFFAEDSDSRNQSEDTEGIRKSYENDLRTGLDNFGVISLTEDPYNLLMWSHYANDHKGIVISIYCDASTFEYHDSFTENCGVSKKEPSRVIYSNRRPGYEMPDNAIYEYFEHNFYSHFALTKGNDWIYEKEFRYILRVNEVDVAIVKARDDEWAESQRRENSDIHITSLGDTFYKVEAAAPSKREFLPWYLAFAQGRKEISEVKLFKRLSRNSLRGVYFGSRVTDDEIEYIKSKIDKNKVFGDSICLYKSVEDQDRFEINFEMIS